MMEREEADKVNLNKKEVVDIVKESPQKQKSSKCSRNCTIA